MVALCLEQSLGLVLCLYYAGAGIQCQSPCPSTWCHSLQRKEGGLTVYGRSGTARQAGGIPAPCLREKHSRKKAQHGAAVLTQADKQKLHIAVELFSLISSVTDALGNCDPWGKCKSQSLWESAQIWLLQSVSFFIVLVFLNNLFFF